MDKWIAVLQEMYPEGTVGVLPTNKTVIFSLVSRPFGTYAISLYPALKLQAKSNCPAGTKPSVAKRLRSLITLEQCFQLSINPLLAAC